MTETIPSCTTARIDAITDDLAMPRRPRSEATTASTTSMIIARASCQVGFTVTAESLAPIWLTCMHG